MKTDVIYKTLNSFSVYLVVAILYLLYAFTFLKPWTITNFSLVDDGQVLMQNASYLESCFKGFDCNNFIAQTLEWGSGRIRPTYWIIQDLVYEAFKTNATYHHLFRVFGFGFAMVMMMTAMLIKMKLRNIPIVLATLLFFTSFSFSENIIRLGPNEPFQVLFLILFSITYLSLGSIEKISKTKFVLLFVFLIVGFFIKESGISLLLAIFFTEVTLYKRLSLKMLLLTGLPVLLFIIYMYLDKTFPFALHKDIPVYANNYLTNPFTILNNAFLIVEILLNTLSPFMKISILILPFFFLSNRFRSSLFDKNFIYWSYFSIFFVSIMFPWRYVLDRYQIAGIMGLSVFISIIFSKVLDLLHSLIQSRTKNSLAGIVMNLLTAFILINLFSHGFSLNLAKTINYRSWYSQFTQFENDQVTAILKFNDKKIFINGNNTISNWEFLYEIPIHLDFLYGQKNNTKLLSKTPSSGSYIFSRTSFDSYLPLDDISKLKSNVLLSNNYSVPQIDPLIFRQKFVMRPVETIINPPLQKDGYNYYWEIRYIK